MLAAIPNYQSKTVAFDSSAKAYTLNHRSQHYSFATREKLERFLSGEGYEKFKITGEGTKSYVLLGSKRSEAFDSRGALRGQLAADSGGEWMETSEKGEKYFIREKGWFGSTIKRVATQEEFIARTDAPSTLRKVMGLLAGSFLIASGMKSLGDSQVPVTAGLALGLGSLHNNGHLLPLVSLTSLLSQVDLSLAGEPYQVASLPQLTVTPGQPVSVTIDLNSIFLDPERQPMIYGGVQMADNRLQLPSWLATKPAAVSNFNPSWSVDKVLVSGDTAFVIESYDNPTNKGYLRILDITDRSNPTLASEFQGAAGGQIYAMAKDSGDIVYLVNSISGVNVQTILQLVNVANPALPSLVSSLTIPGGAYDITLKGHYAFLAMNDQVQVVDVSNSASPSLVGSGLSGLTSVRALASNPALPILYGASYTNLYCLDTTDPAALSILSSFSA